MKNEYLNNKTFEIIIDRFQRSRRSKLRYELIMEDLKTSSKNKKRQQEMEIAFSIAKSKLILTEKELKLAKEDLAIAFTTLAESIVRWRRFSLVETEDTIQEGVLICFQKVSGFDSSKGSAFNYLTTCVLNHFRQMWRSAKNYNELKIKFQDYLCDSFEISVAKAVREKMAYYKQVRESNEI